MKTYGISKTKHSNFVAIYESINHANCNWHQIAIENSHGQWVHMPHSPVYFSTENLKKLGSFEIISEDDAFIELL